MAGALGSANLENPVVFIDLAVSGSPIGRLLIELKYDVAPLTSLNFLRLATNEMGYGYKGSVFHRIVKGYMAQGGDFENGNGSGGKSARTDGRLFADENFVLKHSGRGIVSMANSGVNTNKSQSECYGGHKARNCAVRGS